jgi:hypothetical protein
MGPPFIDAFESGLRDLGWVKGRKRSPELVTSQPDIEARSEPGTSQFDIEASQLVLWLEARVQLDPPLARRLRTASVQRPTKFELI